MKIRILNDFLNKLCLLFTWHYL